VGSQPRRFDGRAQFVLRSIAPTAGELTTLASYCVHRPHGDAVVDDGKPERLSELWDGEFARRMMAVEDRVQGMTDSVFASLFQAAHDLATQLVNSWAAFGRFCQERLGVSPETMLHAWGFPIADDLVAMLKRYEHIQANPTAVDAFFNQICSSWDSKFGGWGSIDDTALRDADGPRAVRADDRSDGAAG
jgi:hypothetical protein